MRGGLHTELNPGDGVAINQRNAIRFLRKTDDGATVLEMRLEKGATLKLDIDSRPMDIVVSNREDSARGKLTFHASRDVVIARKGPVAPL